MALSVKWIPIVLAVRLRSLQQGALNVGNTRQNVANLTALAKTQANLKGIGNSSGWARWNPSLTYKLQVRVALVPGYVAPIYVNTGMLLANDALTMILTDDSGSNKLTG